MARQTPEQAFDRGVEERYKREMGRAAQLDRTDAYMRATTLAHEALVDPTSRYSLGATANALDAVRAKRARARRHAHSSACTRTRSSRVTRLSASF
jgi:hypothetical protein